MGSRNCMGLLAFGIMCIMACVSAQGEATVEVTTQNPDGTLKNETLTETQFRTRFGAPPPPFQLQDPLPIQDTLLAGALEAGQSQVQRRAQNTLTSVVQTVFARLFYPGPIQGPAGSYLENLAGGLGGIGRRRRLHEAV